MVFACQRPKSQRLSCSFAQVGRSPSCGCHLACSLLWLSSYLLLCRVVGFSCLVLLCLVLSSVVVCLCSFVLSCRAVITSTHFCPGVDLCIKGLVSLPVSHIGNNVLFYAFRIEILSFFCLLSVVSVCVSRLRLVFSLKWCCSVRCLVFFLSRSSCLFQFYLALSGLVWSSIVSCYLVLSCLELSCLVVSCLVYVTMSRPVMVLPRNCNERGRNGQGDKR